MELYDNALMYEIAPERFWSYSIREVLDLIRVLDSKAVRKRKQEISDIFLLSKLIAERTWQDKKTVLTMPWDIRPDLFKTEQQEYAQIQQRMELEAYKERRKQLIAEYNKKRTNQPAES